MELTLVNNEPKYWEFIRTLRNLDSVKQGFIQQQEITYEQQQTYMKEYNSCFYVCLADGNPVGYVGVIDNDIRVATHPEHQGKKIGQFMINKLMYIYPNAFAKVKINNEASLKLFESCGFKLKYYILEK